MAQTTHKKKVIGLLVVMVLVCAGVEIFSHAFRDGDYPIRELVFYLRCLQIMVWGSVWGFMSRKVWVKNFTLSFISLTGTLFVIDFVFYIIIVFQMRKTNVETNLPADKISTPNKDLGYTPFPGTTTHIVKTYKNQVVYDIHFTTDKYSRRTNPFDTVKHDRYALFFGCSITFGDGLNDSETIPARVSFYSPQYHAYNFGYSGYGPQEMLANLQKPDVRGQVPEKEGIAFYTYIDNHINRAIGDVRNVNRWGAALPYYYQKGDTLIRDGDFLHGRWLITHFYILLGRSSLLKYFNFNYPFHYREKDYSFVAQMIKQSYNLYIKKFGNDNFYVIIFPGEPLDIVPFLKAQHIKYLDYTKVFDRWSPQNCYMPHDPHPRPVADKILAKKLSSDLLHLVNY